jgi:uncharacterized protein
MTAASLPNQLEQLTSRMLRKKLFLVNLKTKVTFEKLTPHLVEHLEYMTELSRRGVLFASGPIIGANGTPTGDGLSIFNTATADEARRLAERDPFYIHGLRDFEVCEWMLMEGSMTVTLDFAQCRLSVA